MLLSSRISTASVGKPNSCTSLRAKCPEKSLKTAAALSDLGQAKMVVAKAFGAAESSCG